MTAALRTSALAVGYRRRGQAARVVLSGLDLRVDPGRLVCLLGPNGSGKSTLLRTVAGLQPALGGRVALCGDPVDALPARERARRLAVVLTGGIDVGMLRVLDLVALGRHPHTGWDGRLLDEDNAAVSWALDAVGAAALAEREVAELSDGERQRVLIARALAQQPRLLALDEPTAFVDAPRRMELTALLRELAHEGHLGVLMTTHDVDLALRSADVLWLIEQQDVGSARLHVGAPEDLALSGAIARAFAGEGTRFDPARGRFVAEHPPLARVRVEGIGLDAAWAERAVERVGLLVDPDATGLSVRAEGAGSWTVVAGGVETVHGSLGEVAERLRAALPATPGAGQGLGPDPQPERVDAEVTAE